MFNLKVGILLIHAALEAHHFLSDERKPEAINRLGSWCGSVTDALADNDNLAALQKAINEHGGNPARFFEAASADMAALCRTMLKTVHPRLYYGPGLENKRIPASPSTLYTLAVEDNKAKIPLVEDEFINILMIPNDIQVHDAEKHVDAFISPEEVYAWSDICLPFTAHDYDRLYLKSRLHNLQDKDNNAGVLLCGGGLSAAGLRIPGSVNTALPHMSPDYCMYILNKAKNSSRQINTIVLCAPYTFWSHTPDDAHNRYVQHVLQPASGKMIPKLKAIDDFFTKTEESPLIEEMFDIYNARAVIDKKRQRDIAQKDYFNPEFCPYPDKEASPDKGISPAEYAGIDGGIMAENLALLTTFAKKMQKKQVKVILTIPPDMGDTQGRDEFYSAAGELEASGLVRILDYACDTGFTADDFINPGCLNESGSAKLSRLLADNIGNTKAAIY